MYKHVVFWKIKETAHGLQKKEIVAEVMRKLDSLPPIISEIKEVETAVNIGDYQASFYDICSISLFENKDSFLKYTKYPEHDKVVAYIKSVQEAEQIVDFEV